MAQEFELDLERIRERAREKIRDGAVTPAYSADRDRVLEILNDILATEIVCALRYKNHYHMAYGVHGETVAAEFLEHANQEQQHADQVAARIAQLGGNPNMAPDTLASRSHAEYREADSLTDMIREDLIAERVAIDTYSEVVRWLGDGDVTTRRLIETLLAQEEEHADDLAKLLRQVAD